MLMMIFSMLEVTVSIYSLICIVRIFMSWMPEMMFSKFGLFLRAVCDPFLDVFRDLPFTRIGMLDLSPIFALGSLTIVQQIFGNLARGVVTSPIHILQMVISILWSFINFMLIAILIMLAIRLIFELINHNSYSQFWQMLDRIVMPIITKISNIISPKKMLSVRTGLILSFIIIFLIRLLFIYLLTMIL